MGDSRIVISVIVGILIIGTLGSLQETFSSTFPGSNGKIVFDSTRDSGNREIYVMNADGTNPINISNNAAFDSDANWSPDGSKIVFASNRDGNFEIFVMNADGTNPINISNNAAFDLEPSWSADGTKIVFRTQRDGNLEIYVMNADGTNPTRLTNNNLVDLTPSWSPDGMQIAFVQRIGGNDEIFVMNSDGTNPTNLSNNPFPDQQPNWSPDGNKITFRTSRDLGASDEVYVMNSDGTNPINLSNNPSSDINPVWSPDGTKIVFESNRDGSSEIWLMNSDGTNPTQLTDVGGLDTLPDWQPIPILNNSPDCSGVVPDRSVIPSKFHKTVDVILSGFTDVDGDTVTFSIDSITQDEPTNGTGDGDKFPDGFGVGTDTPQIRAERAGTGDGRVYEISFIGEDGNGGTCSSKVSVAVPHNQRRDAIDSGQIFDSTLPLP